MAFGWTSVNSFPANVVDTLEIHATNEGGAAFTTRGRRRRYFQFVVLSVAGRRNVGTMQLGFCLEQGMRHRPMRNERDDGYPLVVLEYPNDWFVMEWTFRVGHVYEVDIHIDHFTVVDLSERIRSFPQPHRLNPGNEIHLFVRMRAGGVTGIRILNDDRVNYGRMVQYSAGDYADVIADEEVDGEGSRNDDHAQRNASAILLPFWFLFVVAAVILCCLAAHTFGSGSF